MADYEVEILVNGKPIKQFRHKGDTFVEGRKSSKFELRFTNNTWKRVEVVPSVDGLSVINGKPSGTASEGYIVSMRDSIVIPGWRLNNDAVAEFVFNDKERSYTSQMGHGKTNAGVIGFMIFEEMEVRTTFPFIPQPYPVPCPNPWPPYRPWSPWDYDKVWCSNTNGGAIGSSAISNSANPIFGSNCSDESLEESAQIFNVTAQCDASQTKICSTETLRSSKSNEVFELGTGWGDELEHKVTLVEFDRHDINNPNEIMVIYYDTRKGLENRGIRVLQTKKRRVKKLPSPFPTYSESGATPPPGWKNRKR